MIKIMAKKMIQSKCFKNVFKEVDYWYSILNNTKMEKKINNKKKIYKKSKCSIVIYHQNNLLKKL